MPGAHLEGVIVGAAPPTQSSPVGTCLGQAFAMAELKLKVLPALVLSRFQLDQPVARLRALTGAQAHGGDGRSTACASCSRTWSPIAIAGPDAAVHSVA